jgi:hypothetical protein
MRSIFFGTGTLVLGLATLMWATTPISAQRGGHGGGGGHSTAHVGSVHYGASVAPVHVGPTVHAGAVHSEHDAGWQSTGGGGVRSPYRAGYSSHFRPGYSLFLLDGAQYYGYDSLPLGYQQVLLGGITYYFLDDVYYQAYIYGGQTVYLVVPDPS